MQEPQGIRKEEKTAKNNDEQKSLKCVKGMNINTQKAQRTLCNLYQKRTTLSTLKSAFQNTQQSHRNTEMINDIQIFKKVIGNSLTNNFRD